MDWRGPSHHVGIRPRQVIVAASPQHLARRYEQADRVMAVIWKMRPVAAEIGS